jgi:hypothetical protein
MSLWNQGGCGTTGLAVDTVIINPPQPEEQMTRHHYIIIIRDFVGHYIYLKRYKKVVRCAIYRENVGRAIAQAVSRRLPIPAARVRARVSPCGICGGQSGTWTSFLRVLLFPLPIRIPPIAPQSSSGAGTMGQLVADVPSGLSLTQPQ